MLRKEGIHKWIHDERAQIDEFNFHFKQKEDPYDYTKSMAQRLHFISTIPNFSTKEVLCAESLITEYQPEVTDKILGNLTARQARIVIYGKKFDGETDHEEKWYGVTYSVHKILGQTLMQWQNAGFHENFHLPQEKPFIPPDLDLLPREENPAATPVVIKDSPLSRVWFKQDNKFLIPKAYTHMHITSPYAYCDPLSTNLTSMFVKAFEDAMMEFLYPVSLFDVCMGFSVSRYGFGLHIDGCDDKQCIFLATIIPKMIRFRTDPNRFDVLKAENVHELKNFKAEEPCEQAEFYTDLLMSEQKWTYEELLEATDDLTVPALHFFIPRLLSQVHLEILVSGNVTKQRTLKLANIAETTLQQASNAKALQTSLQSKKFREFQLPSECYFLYKAQNEVHKLSALKVYYQCFTEGTHANMLLELFSQIVSEPCFDVLRTQGQLGYFVASGVECSSGVQGFYISIQSDKAPQYCEERVEVFLKKMGSELENLEDNNFEKHVSALASLRLEAPKTLLDQQLYYWKEISNKQYHFERDAIEVAHLRTITKQDICQFFKQYIAENAPERRKLAVYVTATATDSSKNIPQAQSGATEFSNSKAVEVTDVNRFKHGLALHPLPKPYINPTLEGSK